MRTMSLLALLAILSTIPATAQMPEAPEIPPVPLEDEFPCPVVILLMGNEPVRLYPHCAPKWVYWVTDQIVGPS